MSLFQLFILSVALGADLFSVSIPIGMQGLNKGRILISSLVFAWFHIMMILTGYFFGHWLGDVLTTGAGNLGAAILILLGVNMLWDSRKNGCERQDCSLLTGGALVGLAVSVSLDAFAAGVGMGMLEVDLIVLSLILGSTIFFISLFGLTLGRKLGCYAGHHAAEIGGLLLILFGIQTLFKIF